MPVSAQVRTFVAGVRYDACAFPTYNITGAVLWVLLADDGRLLLRQHPAGARPLTEIVRSVSAFAVVPMVLGRPGKLAAACWAVKLRPSCMFQARCAGRQRVSTEIISPLSILLKFCPMHP